VDSNLNIVGTSVHGMLSTSSKGFGLITLFLFKLIHRQCVPAGTIFEAIQNTISLIHSSTHLSFSLTIDGEIQQHFG